MAKYTNEELLEAFGEMTLVELSEFVKAFEEKFDVEAAAPAAVAVAAPAAGAAAEEEEKTEFDVVLTAVGDKKIQVIKAVKAITNAGLADAKAMVDGAPKAILEKAKKEDAERPRLSWKRLAPPSSSSNDRGSETRTLQLFTDPAVAHAAAGSARMRRSAHRSRDRFCERLTRPDMGVPHRCALQSEIPASMR
ncbi:50S ribosomal protein L7/L12 [Bifidobacterium bifidum LMG 13195]|nr:50S ribosomal protein L7/L12 [Bifidobacterium bifidum LMG 13195]